MDTLSNQYKMLKKKLNRDEGSMSDTSDDSGMLKKAIKFISKKPADGTAAAEPGGPSKVRPPPVPLDPKELQRMKKT